MFGMLTKIETFFGKRRMAVLGLQPAREYYYSQHGNKFLNSNAYKIVVPNLVGYFHPLLRQYWEFYGLGDECLLVSEPKGVSCILKDIYPQVSFITTDLFSDLYFDEALSHPDYIWDVCLPPPPELEGHLFKSIVCQSLLEHVISPASAIVNFFRLLNKDGHLYLLTHTPSFPIHRYPRDYIRFTHDFFEDLPNFLKSYHGISSTLLELYSHDGIVAACYMKID